MVRLKFKTTNNEVEYNTILARLAMSEAQGAKEINMILDSQVVVNPMMRKYMENGKKKKLKKYLQHMYK